MSKMRKITGEIGLKFCKETFLGENNQIIYNF